MAGGEREGFCFHKPRCSSILYIIEESVMKLTIFIGPEQLRTAQGVYFPYLFNSFAPGFRGNPRRLIITPLNNLNVFLFQFGFISRSLQALLFSYPSLFVGVPTIIADHLKRFFRYMLANSCNKIFSCVNYKIFLVLPMSHFGMIDNCTGFVDIGKLINERRCYE